MSEKQKQWEVVVNWIWGSSHRFRETKVLTFFGDKPTSDEIVTRVAQWWENVAERYRYDCSRVSNRMYPKIIGLTIREVAIPESVDVDLEPFRVKYDRPDDIAFFEAVSKRYRDKSESEIEAMLRRG